jgi:hypothetical protein
VLFTIPQSSVLLCIHIVRNSRAWKAVLLVLEQSNDSEEEIDDDDMIEATPTRAA